MESMLLPTKEVRIAPPILALVPAHPLAPAAAPALLNPSTKLWQPIQNAGVPLWNQGLRGPQKDVYLHQAQTTQTAIHTVGRTWALKAGLRFLAPLTVTQAVLAGLVWPPSSPTASPSTAAADPVLQGAPVGGLVNRAANHIESEKREALSPEEHPTSCNTIQVYHRGQANGDDHGPAEQS